MTSNEPSDCILTDTTVRFHLIDPNGRPVAGAKVGAYAQAYEETASWTSQRKPGLRRPMREERFLSTSPRFHEEKSSGPNDLEEIRTQKLPEGAVYVLQKERNLGTVYTLTDADAGKSFEVRLQPLCHVEGTLSSPELVATMTLCEIYAQIQWQKIRILQQFSQKQKFEFLRRRPASIP